jgi:DNA recombination protein RmuC
MTEITGLLLGGLIVVLAVVAWTLLSARREIGELRARAGAPDATAAMLQQQIESVRVEGRSGQDVLRQELASVSVNVKDELTSLQRGVTMELKGVTNEVTRQLQDGMQLIQSSQMTMGERLDRAAKVVGEVQGSLGSLREATQRVLDVGRDIQGLEQVLKSPKVRGGLGETMLERLLDEMLPREHWVSQHGFRSGEKVDAAIRIGDRIVPVDAKFPLENFRRMVGETDDAQRRQYRKAFARDVKLRVDEIAKKYILPDEGTYDFALMYVPAENVYYEIAIRPEDADDDTIAGYALQRRVVPVSPNSIFAYLQVVVLGLRGLRIEANARQIEEDLARLGGDLGKLRTPLATLGRHLGNAQKQFDDAQRELDKFETKLDEIGRKRVGGDLPAGDDVPRLPGVDG